MHNEIRARWMIRADMCNVVKLDDDTNEWSAIGEDNYLGYLRGSEHIGIVAEDEKQRIRGVICYNLNREEHSLDIWRIVADCFEAHSVLLDYLANKLARHNTPYKVLVIQVSEDDAFLLKLLKNYGFCAKCVVRGEQDCPDCYCMSYQLPIGELVV